MTNTDPENPGDVIADLMAIIIAILLALLISSHLHACSPQQVMPHPVAQVQNGI